MSLVGACPNSCTDQKLNLSPPLKFLEPFSETQEKNLKNFLVNKEISLINKCLQIEVGVFKVNQIFESVIEAYQAASSNYCILNKEKVKAISFSLFIKGGTASCLFLDKPTDFGADIDCVIESSTIPYNPAYVTHHKDFYRLVAKTAILYLLRIKQPLLSEINVDDYLQNLFLFPDHSKFLFTFGGVDFVFKIPLPIIKLSPISEVTFLHESLQIAIPLNSGKINLESNHHFESLCHVDFEVIKAVFKKQVIVIPCIESLQFNGFERLIYSISRGWIIDTDQIGQVRELYRGFISRVDRLGQPLNPMDRLYELIKSKKLPSLSALNAFLNMYQLISFCIERDKENISFWQKTILLIFREPKWQALFVPSLKNPAIPLVYLHALELALFFQNTTAMIANIGKVSLIKNHLGKSCLLHSQGSPKSVYLAPLLPYEHWCSDFELVAPMIPPEKRKDFFEGILKESLVVRGGIGLQDLYLVTYFSKIFGEEILNISEVTTLWPKVHSIIKKHKINLSDFFSFALARVRENEQLFLKKLLDKDETLYFFPVFYINFISLDFSFIAYTPFLKSVFEGNKEARALLAVKDCELLSFKDYFLFIEYFLKFNPSHSILDIILKNKSLFISGLKKLKSFKSIDKDFWKKKLLLESFKEKQSKETALHLNTKIECSIYLGLQTDSILEVLKKLEGQKLESDLIAYIIESDVDKELIFQQLYPFVKQSDKEEYLENYFKLTTTFKAIEPLGLLDKFPLMFIRNDFTLSRLIFSSSDEILKLNLLKKLWGDPYFNKGLVNDYFSFFKEINTPLKSTLRCQFMTYFNDLIPNHQRALLFECKDLTGEIKQDAADILFEKACFDSKFLDHLFLIESYFNRENLKKFINLKLLQISKNEGPNRLNFLKSLTAYLIQYKEGVDLKIAELVIHTYKQNKELFETLKATLPHYEDPDLIEFFLLTRLKEGKKQLEEEAFYEKMICALSLKGSKGIQKSIDIYKTCVSYKYFSNESLLVNLSLKLLFQGLNTGYEHKKSDFIFSAIAQHPLMIAQKQKNIFLDMIDLKLKTVGDQAELERCFFVYKEVVPYFGSNAKIESQAFIFLNKFMDFCPIDSRGKGMFDFLKTYEIIMGIKNTLTPEKMLISFDCDKSKSLVLMLIKKSIGLQNEFFTKFLIQLRLVDNILFGLYIRYSIIPYRDKILNEATHPTSQLNSLILELIFEHFKYLQGKLNEQSQCFNLALQEKIVVRQKAILALTELDRADHKELFSILIILIKIKDLKFFKETGPLFLESIKVLLDQKYFFVNQDADPTCSVMLLASLNKVGVQHIFTKDNEAFILDIIKSLFVFLTLNPTELPLWEQASKSVKKLSDIKKDVVLVFLDIIPDLLKAQIDVFYPLMGMINTFLSLPLTQKEIQVIYSPHLLDLIGGHLNKIPKEFIFNKENPIEDSFMKSENFFSAPTDMQNHFVLQTANDLILYPLRNKFSFGYEVWLSMPEFFSTFASFKMMETKKNKEELLMNLHKINGVISKLLIDTPYWEKCWVQYSSVYTFNLSKLIRFCEPELNKSQFSLESVSSEALKLLVFLRSLFIVACQAHQTDKNFFKSDRKKFFVQMDVQDIIKSAEYFNLYKKVFNTSWDLNIIYMKGVYSMLMNLNSKISDPLTKDKELLTTDVIENIRKIGTSYFFSLIELYLVNKSVNTQENRNFLIEIALLFEKECIEDFKLLESYPLLSLEYSQEVLSMIQEKNQCQGFVVKSYLPSNFDVTSPDFI